MLDPNGFLLLVGICLGYRLIGANFSISTYVWKYWRWFVKFLAKSEFGAKNENPILTSEKLERALPVRRSMKEGYNLLKTVASPIFGGRIKKSYFEYCNYSIFMSDNIAAHGSRSEAKVVTICA